MKTIFAKRLQEALEIRGIKQVELVKKTGITKGAISSYLKGEYTPKQNNTYKIAEALNVDYEWLMGKDDLRGNGNSSQEHYYLNEETRKVVQELIEIYDSLSDVGKRDVVNFAQYTLHKENEDRRKKLEKKILKPLVYSDNDIARLEEDIESAFGSKDSESSE